MKVTIVGLDDEGNGFGFYNSKKVIIPKTAQEDVVEFSVVKENKDYVVGRVENMIEASHHRRKPMACTIFGSCGGCSLQHLDDILYYDLKNKILENSVKNSGYELRGTELVRIGKNRRRRAIFHVRSNTFGFFEKGSNSNIVDVMFCPLLNNQINNIIPKLRSLVNLLKLNNIEVTSYENGLSLVFTFKEKTVGLETEEFLKNFADRDENIIGISYRENIRYEPIMLIQKKYPKVTFDNGIHIELSSNIFLQATEKGQDEITKIVIDGLKKCKNIADLYCGVGTYTFPLSSYGKISSFEGSEIMINILNRNIKNNNLSSKITGTTRDLVNQPLLKKELDKFDGVVINPPRNGARAQCEFLAQSNVDKIVMVSCNPRAFSVDASKLREGGYSLERVVGIDQFYWTPHLEVVGIFSR